MFKRALITIAAVLGLLTVSLVMFPHLSDNTVKAASVQKWDYAQTVFFPDTKTIVALSTNDEDNDQLQKQIETIDTDENGTIGILRLMGENGWELVQQNVNTDPNYILSVYKRPVQ